MTTHQITHRLPLIKKDLESHSTEPRIPLLSQIEYLFHILSQLF